MTKKNIVVILLSMILTLALFVPSASAWRHRPPRVRVGLFLPPPPFVPLVVRPRVYHSPRPYYHGHYEWRKVWVHGHWEWRKVWIPY